MRAITDSILLRATPNVIASHSHQEAGSLIWRSSSGPIKQVKRLQKHTHVVELAFNRNLRNTIGAHLFIHQSNTPKQQNLRSIRVMLRIVGISTAVVSRRIRRVVQQKTRKSLGDFC